MRKNIRDHERLGHYVAKLNEVAEQRAARLHSLIDEITFAKSTLDESASHLMKHLSGRGLSGETGTHNIVWRWRPHTNPTRIRPIEVLLMSSTRDGDNRQQRTISLRSRDARLNSLEPLMGKRQSARFSRDLDRFLVLADRVARWASAGSAPCELNSRGVQYGLQSWIDLVGTTCERVAVEVSGVVETFLQIDAELSDHVLEFNAQRQPVRFHSIICRRDVVSADPLSPSAPRFRVVEYLDRRTGKRSSRDVQSYKRKMSIERTAAELKATLGRTPSKEEIDEEVSKQRMRMPSPWITAELISHCWLGKHSAGILRLQKTMAAAMAKWEASRSFLQALL